MDKQIFKLGDRVYDIRHGWGTITRVTDDFKSFFPIWVDFDNGYDKQVYTLEGASKIDKIPMLSFTEYGFDDRFTQGKSINYHDYLNKWGKFWNDNPEYFTIGILKGYEQGGHKPFHSVNLDFQNFKPLTDEQVKILELE